jgi:hypothetical protein
MNSTTLRARLLPGEEVTTQRSNGYSVGQAATVISATGKQARGIPIIYCEPPCPEHLCRVFSQQHWCRYSESDRAGKQ